MLLTTLSLAFVGNPHKNSRASSKNITSNSFITHPFNSKVSYSFQRKITPHESATPPASLRAACRGVVFFICVIFAMLVYCLR